MQGMVELESYKSSLALLENMVVLPQGSVTRRPGTFFGSSTPSNAQVRLIPFNRGQGTSVVLEFSNNKIRFYANDGIVESSGSPYEKTTTYTTDQLADISFTQSADVLFLVHPTHPPRELKRLDVTNWTLTDIVFKDGPYFPVNTEDTTLTISLADTANWTTSFTNSTLEAEQVITVTASSVDIATESFTSDNHPFVNGQKVRFTGGTSIAGVTAGTDYFIVQATQNTFKLATSAGGTPVDITNAPTTDLTFFQDIVGKDAYIKIVASNTTGINLDLGFQSTDVGRLIRLNTQVAPQIKWGYAQILELDSSAPTTTILARTKGALATPGATTEWQLGSFSSTTGYPRSVQIYQQRLVFGGTSSEPQTVYFSKTADFNNFAASEPLGQSTGRTDSAGKTIIGEQIF